MSDCLMIEPWAIESDGATLTLREEATVRDFVLGGGVALGLSLIGAALDVWLWRRGTIGGALAAGLGFTAALIAAKGIEQFFQAWRVTSRGPRCLMFRQNDHSVELQGFRGMTGWRVEQILVEVETWRDPNALPGQHHAHQTFRVSLIGGDQEVILGTYGAEGAASRLAEVISNCIGVPITRRTK